MTQWDKVLGTVAGNCSYRSVGFPELREDICMNSSAFAASRETLLNHTQSVDHVVGSPR